MRREDAVVEDEVDSGRRNEGGEFFEEGQRVEEQKGRSVGVGSFDLVEDSSVWQL
jgi:hypothetical protein